MNPDEVSCTDATSMDDVCTTKFLELLLRYDYQFLPNDQEAFNLQDEAQTQFMKDCQEFLPNFDETQASKEIIRIRELYFKELAGFYDSAKESELSWFPLAHKIFSRAQTSERGASSTSQPLDLTKSLSKPSDSESREKLTHRRTRSLTDLSVADVLFHSKDKVRRRSETLPPYFNIKVSIPWLCAFPPFSNPTSIDTEISTSSDAESSTPPACQVSSSHSPVISTSCVTPVASISPGAADTTSPITVHSTLTAAATKTEISPISTTSISPAARTSISPAATTSISPAATTSISPAARTSLSPAARTSLSPAARTSLSPAARTSLSPAARSSLSPATKAETDVGASTSPSYKRMLSNESISVVKHNKIS